MAALKPAGILVYNNVAGDSLMLMSVTTLDVPAAFISQENGQAMLAAADHHLTLVDGKTITPSSNYSMSDFSSWGVTPDLRLKPEVSAPGGSIYSAVLDGKYDHLSGTSMASPHAAGVAALVKEIHPDYTADEVIALVKKQAGYTYDRLAEPTDGKEYRGAGLVNALDAVLKDQPKPVMGSIEYSYDGGTDWRPLADATSRA